MSNHTTLKNKIELESLLNTENHIVISLQITANHDIDLNLLQNLLKQLTMNSQIPNYKIYKKPKKEKPLTLKKKKGVFSGDGFTV